MQAEIFPLFYRDNNEALCHMFYKEWLVFNLAEAHVKDCIALIDKGKPHWLNCETPFLLNDKFNVAYKDNSCLVFSDGINSFYEDGFDKDYVNKWLIKHLHKLGYVVSADVNVLYNGCAEDQEGPETLYVGTRPDFYGNYIKDLYLFYKNYLIINLPENKLNECLVNLDNTGKVLPAMGTCFKLDKTFSLRIEKFSRSLHLQDAHNKMELNYFVEMFDKSNTMPKVKEWVVTNLFHRDFEPVLRPACVSGARLVKYMLAWAVWTVLVVAGSFAKFAIVEDDSIGFMLPVPFVILVVGSIGIFLFIKWKLKSSQELVFIKTQ